MGTAKFIRSKSDDIKKLMDTEWSHVKSEDKYMMDVDALRAVQTSGPTHSGDSCERLCNPGIDGCLQSNWSTTASFEHMLGDRLLSFVGSVDIYARGGSSSNTDHSLWVSELAWC